MEFDYYRPMREGRPLGGRLTRIERYMGRWGIDGHIYGSKLLLLDITNAEAVPDDYLSKYLDARETAAQKRIFNNCLDVGNKTVRDGRAVGTIATPDDAEQLAGWANHCINYDLLPDGSALAFDLTARENITYMTNAYFAVLALRTESLDTLTAEVGELYGGSWNALEDTRRSFDVC